MMEIKENNKLIFFRTDVRRFLENEIIPWPGDHINRISGEAAQLGETRLRAFSKNLHELRANNLFVYTTLYAAMLQHIRFGGHVYRVEVEQEDILHTADLKLVEEVGRASKADYSKVAQLYLNQETRGSRIVETIVKKAKVLARLYDTSETESSRQALDDQQPDRATDFGRLLSTPLPNT